MKIVILGDTHFGARNDSPFFHTYFEKFYNDVFFPFIDSKKITTIIQLGDMFDRRKYINFQSLKRCREYFFDPLAERKITMHVIVGNHDTYYKNTNDVNSLSLLLREYNNINIINDPTLIEFDDCKSLFVPWICPDNEKECIEAIQQNNADVIIGHFEIQGFEMYRGSICDEGMDVSMFPTNVPILSGHFHHKSTHGNIHYLGTPYEITWSDYDDQKSFHVFDTDTKTYESINNPYAMFHKIHYDDHEKTLKDVMSFDAERYTNCIVKVIVRNKNNPEWFDLFVEKLEKAGVVDMQVVEDHFHLDLESDNDIINEAEDTLTILNKYVDQLDVQVDRQRLDNLIRTLYHEALEMERI